MSLSLRLCFAGLVLLLMGLAPRAAEAHLMLDGQGTLHFTGDGAFLMVSVPVSAFTGVDDDGDGRLSPREVYVHQAELARQATRGLRLADAVGARPFEGALVNASLPHGGTTASHVVVMGRFARGATDEAGRLTVGLFGGERSIEIRAKRGDEVETFVFTERAPTHAWFPAGPAARLAGILRSLRATLIP